MSKKEFYTKLLSQNHDDLASGRTLRLNGQIRQYDRNLIRRIAPEILGFRVIVTDNTICRRFDWTPPKVEIVSDINSGQPAIVDDGDTGL